MEQCVTFHSLLILKMCLTLSRPVRNPPISWCGDPKYKRHVWVLPYLASEKSSPINHSADIVWTLSPAFRFKDYLSEMPMPDEYPAWPSGPQVQAYLETFCTKFNLMDRIHLSEAVTSAVQDPSNDNSWTVTTCESSTKDGTILPNGKERTYTFDVLLVCNGTFSDCFVPNYKGIEEFRKAGGTVCHTSEFLDLEEARGKDIIVVGYGKSACDSAVALSKVANTTVSSLSIV